MPNPEKPGGTLPALELTQHRTITREWNFSELKNHALKSNLPW